MQPRYLVVSMLAACFLCTAREACSGTPGEEEFKKRKTTGLERVLRFEAMEEAQIPEFHEEAPTMVEVELEAFPEKGDRKDLPRAGQSLTDWIISGGQVQAGESAKDVIEDILAEKPLYHGGLVMKEKRQFAILARRFGAAPKPVLDVEEMSLGETLIRDASGFFSYSPKYDNNIFKVQGDTESFTQEMITGLRYQRMGTVGVDITSSLTYEDINLRGPEQHPSPPKTKSGAVEFSYNPTRLVNFKLTTDFRKTNDVDGEDAVKARSISEDQWNYGNTLFARGFLSPRDIWEFTGAYTYQEGQTREVDTGEVKLRRHGAVKLGLTLSHIYSKRLTFKLNINRDLSVSKGRGFFIKTVSFSPALGATVAVTPHLSVDLNVRQDQFRVVDAVKNNKIDSSDLSGPSEEFGVTGNLNYRFTFIPRTTASVAFSTSDFERKTSTRVDVNKSNVSFKKELVDIAIRHELAFPPITILGAISSTKTTEVGEDSTTLTTYSLSFSRPIYNNKALLSVQYKLSKDRVTTKDITEATDKSGEYDQHVFFLKTTYNFGVPKR